MHSSERGDRCASVQESGLCICAQHCKVPVFGQMEGLSPGRAGLERHAPGSPLALGGAALCPAQAVPPRSRLRPALAVLAVALLGGHQCLVRGGIAALCLRMVRARFRCRVWSQSRPQPRLLPGPAEDTGSAATPAAASPAWALPLSSAASGYKQPGPEAGGDAGPGVGEGHSGAIAGPGSSTDSRVPPAGKAHEALQERYWLGSLLGCGGFGSVFAATQLSDGALVAIKHVLRDRIRPWGELAWHGFGPTDGTSAMLEIVLLAKVSRGCGSVIQLLEWLELPNSFLLVLERPEQCQELSGVLAEWGFLPEEAARELFRQVLEAVRHCTSCGVLHRDIKPKNILLDLATGQAKLIDFGCGTYLQDTVYTHFAGTQSYSPPEWNDFGWHHGKTAMVWSLGILLHQMVCGEHPFRRGQNISWGQLLLPQRLSQECKDLIGWCLSVNSLDRPTLEDLFCDPWMQDIPLLLWCAILLFVCSLETP
ncbi:serine/threonine-protein kinase pim-1-like [Melospiza georgiana]|uniref:serine/threonine-protein kinase pim-1-like n=1 Tax=Melospiza georgiana TaxID=44398 RepID=UPI0025AC97EB|nr:serine/threonine-protein kinase pim-1-like [Melospiza georgiana]